MMGQLDIQVAQQIARENDRNLTRAAEFTRLAAQRGAQPARGTGRRPGLRTWGQRLHVLPSAHPVRLA